MTTIALDNPSCKGYDPAIWDTITRGGVTSRLGTVKVNGARQDRFKVICVAKEICRGCPELITCREAGRDEPEGIWGGLLPDERQ